MNYPRLVKDIYLSKYSCSEAIVHGAKKAKLVKVPNAVLKASTGFMGGIGHCKSICGTITAAVMLIGLKYGRTSKDQPNKIAGDKSAAIYNKFIKRFKSAYCRDLTRKFKDFASPERRKHCVRIVEYAAKLIHNEIK